MFRILDHCAEKNRASLDFVHYWSVVVQANNGDGQNLESHVPHVLLFFLFRTSLRRGVIVHLVPPCQIIACDVKQSRIVHLTNAKTMFPWYMF